MKSTKELTVGKLYCIASPEKRSYRETSFPIDRNYRLGYFIKFDVPETKNMSNNQRFFLFLGLDRGKYMFFTSGYEVVLNPGAVLSLKEVATKTKD
jgi:hypothetical protein